MAIKHVVTRGFIGSGIRGGVFFVPTAGYAGRGVGGPFCVDIIEGFTAGVIIDEGFSAGSKIAEGFSAGSIISQEACD